MMCKREEKQAEKIMCKTQMRPPLTVGDKDPENPCPALDLVYKYLADNNSV